MKIVSFGDQFTKGIFESNTQKTFAMIKPDCFHNAGKIISIIEESSLSILSLQLHQMTVSEAQEFYAEHKGKPFYDNLVQFISSAAVIGLELMGKSAVSKWRELLGPTNCFMARNESPNSIRALYGTEGVRNAAHGSDSPQSAQREIDLFFKKFEKNVNCFASQWTQELAKENHCNFSSSNNQKSSKNPITGMSNLGSMKVSSPNLPNLSCLVIKPHVMKDGMGGQVLDSVLKKCSSTGLKITAIEMFNLNKEEVEEFLEVYKGVLPEYGLLIEEMKNGNLIAMMIQGEGNVVQSLRKICGPHDPQVAKVLRGDSLRSEFGKDKVKNGIHCTDLEDDGILECEFFFSVMQK